VKTQTGADAAEAACGGGRAVLLRDAACVLVHYGLGGQGYLFASFLLCLRPYHTGAYMPAPAAICAMIPAMNAWLSHPLREV